MVHKVFSLRKFKALDEGQGIFEAIVAVFGNVDRAGDKIVPGAFAKSLERWDEKGRPIPVIFAHEWDNLDAHIGQVVEAKEQDEGLYVKAQLDMEEEFARRVWKRMKRGTLAEFSFAYDVLDSKFVQGVNELRELELLEVGPCLVGMNPETQLLGVKRGARHTAKEFELIQKVHDLIVELGAKCAAHDEDGEDGEEGEDEPETRDGKGGRPKPSTLAARVALELMELDADE